jgi:chromosome segregation ATPase
LTFRLLSLVGTTLRLSEYFLNQGTLKVRESSIFSEKFTFSIAARAKMSDDGMSTPPSTSKSTIQLNKMREANAKYKSLLKMAKERIQAQEEEIESLRANMQQMVDNMDTQQPDSTKSSTAVEDDMQSEAVENASTISRVHQRVTVNDGEIWALFEFEIPNPDMPEAEPLRVYKKWKRFETESELSDFIRRDSGEPLSLPPYSLSPAQSQSIQEESRQAVSRVTEEFRRFRVRAEVARKQADAQIRDLQSNKVQSAKRRIEGQDFETELEQARTEHEQLERLRVEMAAQEAQWKEAYDLLMAENNSLKSSGSEAMLASQWRHRYEACLAEKEDLESRLKMENENRKEEDAGKYEMKYRDLKESFRLYRKKAKEIFEAQQRGDVALLQLNDNSAEDAKLSYIRNLMVNYFTSDPEVREHMEGAIGTVLKFSPDDIARIEAKKQEDESWF